MFGEQVSSPDALAWLDIVFDDMEGETYTVGAADLCAPGVGAPHIRNRTFFVADAAGRRFGVERDASFQGSMGHVDGGSEFERMGDSYETGSQRRIERGNGGHELPIGTASLVSDVADAERKPGCAEHEQEPRRRGEKPIHASEPGSGRSERGTGARGPVNGYWADAIWIPCKPEREGEEGRYRPAQSIPFEIPDELAIDLGCLRYPGGNVVFPLIQGGKARAFRLRGYGDGIVAELAEEFIVCYAEERGITLTRCSVVESSE